MTDRPRVVIYKWKQWKAIYAGPWWGGVDNAYAFYISQVMKLAVQNYIGPLFFANRK